MKGVLWRHGKSLRLSALDHMKDLVSFVRADLAALHLPFVVGKLPGNDAMNTQLAALASDVHAIGVASMEGLDEQGVQALGERYGEQMLKIQREWADWEKRRSRTNIPIVDTHVHGSSNKENGLDIVARWMAKNNVSHCITHALTPTRVETESQRKF